jgi:catechol 2,3-dioxygenase-like lactoylglutathione lyase family enzyme
MRIEHVAFNIPEPEAAAEWYANNLDMRIVRRFGPPNHAHFLADAGGSTMIEIYCNTKATVPDYRTFDPLILHLAFAVDDVRAMRDRLLKAGAIAAGDVVVADNGDHLTFVRDPWGFPIQLVKRAAPMV